MKREDIYIQEAYEVYMRLKPQKQELDLTYYNKKNQERTDESKHK